VTENNSSKEPFFIPGARTGRSTYCYPTSSLSSTLLFALFFLLGLLLLHKTVPRLQDRSRLEKEGVQTSGVIESTDGGRRCTRSIAVSYEDAAKNVWHKKFDTVCYPYHGGQSVEVIYLPSIPATAMLGAREAGIPKRQDAIGAAIGGFLTLFGGLYALKFCFRRQRGLNLQ